ncbi:tripartite ATP-independent transporter DctP family solute receptor [Bacillus thermophilus]|uniref:Tripartite ATP-independent transporter DctP family solute receptor n=1 Tax=Siminovitchia thermophila TaxID=1245522 RepID=A0ABS2R0R3_9BACI|nr:TRAP transporter substrate-binding protein DctP [Siminovitchia thermophila]MBM7713207.1 tripartite ATP-independent transporter DctP family solute receptor [Siminovitchia thermophila]
MLLILLVFIMMGAACGGESSSGQTSFKEEKDKPGKSANSETFNFKAGHSLTEDHPYHIGLTQIAENVKERTDGKINIQVFPLSQLGAERELTEALTLGTADMSISSTAPIANFYPEIGNLPFLFESREHAYKVLDGEIGHNLLGGLEDVGIVGLAWGENGFRHMTNAKKPIEKPEDLNGLKIRTQESPIHLDAFTALGAKPAPMAWTEALTVQPCSMESWMRRRIPSL